MHTELLSSCLNSLRTEYLMGGRLRCDRDWHDINYIPDYNKFYYILGGECELTINGIAYRPQAGQLFLMPAHVLQSYRNINDNCVEKYWCHFRCDVNGINLFDIVKTGPFVEDDGSRYLYRQFDRLIRAARGNTVSSMLDTKAALLDIIAFFIEKNDVRLEAEVYKDAADLTPVLRYIEQNLQKDIKVRELAALVHLHPNYFINCFKNRLGMPPGRYIVKMRMERAKQLLKTTELPVSEVAARVGVGDLFYFSRIFKKTTGFSPTRYRGCGI